MSAVKSLSRRAFIRSLAGVFVAGAVTLGAESATVHAQSDEGVVLILNARNPTQSLSPADVKKLFLGQTAFWHGVVPVKLLVRPDTSKAAESFYQPTLGMTAQAFRKHWAEVELAGRGVAPKTVGPAEELAKLVSQTPGALSFALTSEAWRLPGVKVVPVK